MFSLQNSFKLHRFAQKNKYYTNRKHIYYVCLHAWEKTARRRTRTKKHEQKDHTYPPPFLSTTLLKVLPFFSVSFTPTLLLELYLIIVNTNTIPFGIGMWAKYHCNDINDNNKFLLVQTKKVVFCFPKSRWYSIYINRFAWRKLIIDTKHNIKHKK